MPKREKKLPSRFRADSITPAHSIRQSSRQSSTAAKSSTAARQQRDAGGRYGSTLSPEPTTLSLNDTVDEDPPATTPQHITRQRTTKAPTRKRSATATSRPRTTKKRKTTARGIDENYVSSAHSGRKRTNNRKPTSPDETEDEEAGFAGDNSLESDLEQPYEGEGDNHRSCDNSRFPLSQAAVGTDGNIGPVPEIALEEYWFADEEIPPMHPGRARKLKRWELNQYIRRSDDTVSRIHKLLRDTQWLEDADTTKQEGVPNYARLRKDSNGYPIATEQFLNASAPLRSSGTSTSENNYLSPLPPNITRTPSPTIRALRASGGGVLGKAPTTPTSAVWWVMQRRLTPSASTTECPTPSREHSRGDSPLDSPRLQVDSHYHASIGTPTPPPNSPAAPLLAVPWYPDALRTGNDYSRPRGVPHTPPRVDKELNFLVGSGMKNQSRAWSAGRKS